MEHQAGNMEREAFTENELIEALVNALELDTDTGGFMSCKEIVAKLGWSDKRVLKHLHGLNAAGLLEVGKVHIIDIAGRNQTVAAYRLKQQTEES